MLVGGGGGIPSPLPQNIPYHMSGADQSVARAGGEPRDQVASIRRKIENAELNLLLDLTAGKKSFAQVGRDAVTFSYRGSELQSLCHTNAARGIAQRLAAAI